jgi:hypothetical protein
MAIGHRSCCEARPCVIGSVVLRVGGVPAPGARGSRRSSRRHCCASPSWSELARTVRRIWRNKHLALGVSLALAAPLRARADALASEPNRSAVGASPATDFPASIEAEASAYCRYVIDAAESASALLYSPRVFSSFGVVRGYPTDPEGPTGGGIGMLLNFRAGVEVSPTRMYSGALLTERARVDCERHRAEAALEVLPVDVYDARPALRAKADVLRAALPEAAQLLAASQDKLNSSLTTLQSHMALRLRVESHKRVLAELEAELASLQKPASPAVEPRKVFDAIRQWESRQHSVDARTRRLEAVNVILRGGYDEFLSVPQKLPVFGSISLGFVPGWFWQDSAEERSAAGRRDWVEAKIQRARASLRDSLERLSNQLDVARHELQDLLVGLADLEQRYADLKGVNTPSAQDLMEYLWFDLVRLRADRVHAEARVHTLQRQARALEDSLR